METKEQGVKDIVEMTVKQLMLTEIRCFNVHTNIWNYFYISAHHSQCLANKVYVKR